MDLAWLGLAWVNGENGEMCDHLITFVRPCTGDQMHSRLPPLIAIKRASSKIHVMSTFLCADNASNQNRNLKWNQDSHVAARQTVFYESATANPSHAHIRLPNAFTQGRSFPRRETEADELFS
ncbi:hypothetical protein IE81DRAFT_236863 [Ceraceosorus guamensis]|uniref:Uncharacterized protein n=1 Tax=Ceraceosorus guamensis TaxID=1522189 RepID=A0A316VSI0_9BASI|nr:hypothetical protein IE81DRAFT_236863 [Ceraceosorus guamensis]PWN40174.1 hypothetical protein IE81DRAFT_236863 [Ceraceosorus guamensis]